MREGAGLEGRIGNLSYRLAKAWVFTVMQCVEK